MGVEVKRITDPAFGAYGKVITGYELSQLLEKMGETPLPALTKSDRAVRFLQDGLAHPAPCASCQWQSLCFGGCKRDWYDSPDGGKQNYYCPAFRQFFAHAAPRLQQIARAELQARGR